MHDAWRWIDTPPENGVATIVPRTVRRGTATRRRSFRISPALAAAGDGCRACPDRETVLSERTRLGATFPSLAVPQRPIDASRLTGGDATLLGVGVTRLAQAREGGDHHLAHVVAQGVGVGEH